MAQAVKHTRGNPVEELNRVLNLDYDAIKTYEAAISRLHSESYRRRLEDFKQDHLRHVQSIASLVSDYGGQVLAQGESRSVLSQGSIVVANIVGDQGVLKAMNCNERLTNETYQDALARLEEYPDILKVLQDNLQDEQRHKRWLEQALEAT